MTQPVEYRTQNENAHTGEVRVVIPDPATEPLWSDTRTRAVALELAIKTVTDHPSLISSATGNVKVTADIVMVIADRYRGFIGRTEPTDG